jgi:hypothetical protein
MAEKPTKEGWLTSDQAADLVSVTTARIRQLCLSGQVICRKVGRDWLVDQESLLSYKATARRGRPRKAERED